MRELDAAASALADRLHALGVDRGDRIAVLLPNGAEAAIAIYGTLRAGAAFVPLNPTIKADKLAYVLRDCEATAVITDDALAPLAQEAGAGARASATHARRGACGRARDAILSRGHETWPAGQDRAPRPPPAPRAGTPISVDLAAIVYTSGSTGRPKGVTLTHANMTFAAGSIVAYLEMAAEDRVLCVVPLSFDYGLYQLLMCVRVGATLVLERGFAFPGRVLELLERERITGLPGVPTIFQVLALRAGARRSRAHDLPHLRFLTNTAAALAPATIDALRAAFPQRPALLDVRADRVQARLLSAARAARRPSRVGRDPDPRHRGVDRGRRRHATATRRGRRADRARCARDAGLLERPGRDGRAAATRPLAVGARARDRRPLPPGRGGLPLLRRAQGRHPQVARREGRAARGRGRPARGRGRAHGCRRRRPRPPARPGDRRLRRRRTTAPSSRRPRCAATAPPAWRTTWSPRASSCATRSRPRRTARSTAERSPTRPPRPAAR